MEALNRKLSGFLKTILFIYVISGAGIQFIFAQATSERLQASFQLGNGVQLTSSDSLFSGYFSVRFQNKYALHQDLDGEKKITNLNSEIRRLRFIIGGYIGSSRLRFYIHHTLDKGKSRLFMAYTEYQLTPNIEIGIGQFKVDATRLFMVSSNNLGMVDRSIADLRFMQFFDLGAYLHYRKQLGSQVIKAAFNLTGGEGPNVDIEPNGYNYVGRLDWLPLGSFKKGGDFVETDLFFEESPRMALGGSVSFNNNAIRLDGERGDFILPKSTDITTYSIDGIFKYRGNSLLFQYVNRDNSTFEVLDTDKQPVPIFGGEGYTIQADRTFNKKHVAAFRVSRILPSHRIEELVNNLISTTQTKLLAGYTRFLKGHDLKWQIDAGVVFLDDQTENVEHQLVVRTQFHINL